MRDELKYDFQRREGFGTPIDRDKGKQTMLNLVPFAGGRWILTFVSSLFACHSRPLFLKVPSNSFFLQSTEMIGS
jgi:hypothetical protein